MPMQIDLGGETHELKYSFGAIRAMEREAGVGITKLLSADRQGFDTICLLIWAGLLHEYKNRNKKQTTAQVEEDLNEYIETGGTIEALSILITQALIESKVLGKQVAEGNGQIR